MLLEVKEVTKSFRSGTRTLPVLTGVNLEVEAGDMVAITGASGVGKSTLLHIIGALEPPTSGRVRIDGEEVTEMAGQRLDRLRNLRVGFVFQFHQLLTEFTAVENVMLPALIAGEERSRACRRAAELLERVGLSDRLDHRPGELSGGECQRVGLARALVNNPKIVLADEPTGNLDKQTGKLLYDYMRQLNRNLDKTFIFATHDPNWAIWARKVYNLEEGVLVEVEKC